MKTTNKMKIKQGFCPKCGVENEISGAFCDYDDGCHFYHMECPKCGCIYDEVWEEIYTGVNIDDEHNKTGLWWHESDDFQLTKAAPDLLEALKALLSDVDFAMSEGAVKEGGFIGNRQIRNAREAIAKAERQV